jgi:protein arginine N-methyltransferase 1
MIAHRVRVGSYRRALERVVKPGAVIVDIGTGTGLFAVFACQLGARKVFAIENGEIIELARQIAKDNGCAERIEFIRELSTRVELPTRADVVVADIHGTLPVYGGSLAALIDARKRFLAPGGAMVPRLERIWTAAIKLPRALYAEEVDVWRDAYWGVDLSAGRRFGTDSEFKVTLRPKQLVTQPGCVATLDYQKLESPSISSALTLRASRNGYPNGYGFWFDSELADGIHMSTAPGHARAEFAAGVYPNAVAPWPEPVRMGAGDEIKATLCFTAVKDDYVWQWNTRVETADSHKTKAKFSQSNFNSRFISAAGLHKRAPTYRPRLNKRGAVARMILELMDGGLSHTELARLLMERFPGEFADENEALQTTADLSERYCE